jgi:hypothetical protein
MLGEAPAGDEAARARDSREAAACDVALLAREGGLLRLELLLLRAGPWVTSAAHLGPPIVVSMVLPAPMLIP